MANRYVRSTGGNWNATGTWEQTPGGGESVAVPTAADDVYLVVGSGQLTITATAACRSFDCTGYANTITHNNGITLTVGTSTDRGDGFAFKLDGTYTLGGSTSTITFNSSSGNTLTVDFNGKTVNVINFSGGNYTLQNNWTQAYALTHTSGTLDFNGKTVTFSVSTGTLNSTGTTARTLTLGASALNFSGTTYTAWTCSGSNLTVSANTAVATFLNTSTGAITFAGGGFDFNGLTVKSYDNSTTGGFTITGANTFGSLICYTVGGSRTLTLPVSTTTTVTGNIYIYGVSSYIMTITSSAGTATLSKSSGTVDFYNCTFGNGSTIYIAVTGGATFNAKNNCTYPTYTTGFSSWGGNFYMDYVSGNDSTTNTPYGWWSVAYSSASGTMPAVGETMTGASATAKVCWVHPYEWDNIKSGTMYFYGKSGTFGSEAVTFTGGGSCNVTGDLTYCAWQTVTSGATAARIGNGDTIRIAKSSAPTLIGAATWDGTGLGIAVTPTSSTNATPIVFTKSGHGLNVGDYVMVTGHTTNTNANGMWQVSAADATTFTIKTLNGKNSVGNGVGGATGSFYKCNNKVVTLDSAVTALVSDCELDGVEDYNWTAANSAVVTPTNANTDAKSGGACIKITAPASPASNTLYAYQRIASTNYSGYQQLTFWIKNEVAIADATTWRICLCDDTAGASIQNSFAVPAIPSTGQWVPITVDLGSAMYNGAQSVAVYSGATAPTASKYIYIDNINACKDDASNDSLTLQSLISKTSGEQSTSEGCYAIQSINGAKLVIDNDNNCKSSSGMGYYSSTASENVNTYKKETTKTSMASAYQTLIFAATDTSYPLYPITYAGGYDPTTNSQTGETFFDGLNGFGYGFYLNGKNYITLDRMSLSRYYGAITHGGTTYGSRFTNSLAISNYYGIYISANAPHYKAYIDNLILLNNYRSYLDTNYQPWDGSNFKTIFIKNDLMGHYFNLGYSSIIENFYCYNSKGITLRGTGGLIIQDLVIAHPAASLTLTGLTYGFIKVHNLTVTDNYTSSQILVTGSLANIYHCSIPVDSTLCSSASNYISVQRYNGDSNDNRIYYYNSYIASQTSVRHTASGVAWQMSPLASGRDIYQPVTFSVARIAVVADKEVTVKAWMKRSSATDIDGTFRILGGQLAGVSSTLYANATTGSTSLTSWLSGTDWTEGTIKFTPTEAGVIEVEGFAYYVTGTADESVYIDDISVTQA